MIYQLTFIVQNEADQEVVKKTLEQVGARVLEERLVGQRKFTYPIKKLTEGIYLTYHIDIDPQAIPDLDKKLRFEDKIIRFLIVRTETLIKPVQVVPMKETAPVVPTVVEKPTREIVKPAKPAKAVAKPKTVAPVVDEAERLKKLEEKLKELLQE